MKWVEENDDLPPGLYDTSNDETSLTRTSRRRPNALNVIRDKQMHGYVFEETLPWGGLFETIKATVEHAYRNHATYDVHQESGVACLRSLNDGDQTAFPPGYF